VESANERVIASGEKRKKDGEKTGDNGVTNQKEKKSLTQEGRGMFDK